MLKHRLSYLLILDKMPYVMTTGKPLGDDFTSQKMKLKWEGDSDITKPNSLVICMMICFPCTKSTK